LSPPPPSTSKERTPSGFDPFPVIFLQLSGLRFGLRSLIFFRLRPLPSYESRSFDILRFKPFFHSPRALMLGLSAVGGTSCLKKPPSLPPPRFWFPVLGFFSELLWFDPAFPPFCLVRTDVSFSAACLSFLVSFIPPHVFSGGRVPLVRPPKNFPPSYSSPAISFLRAVFEEVRVLLQAPVQKTLLLLRDPALFPSSFILC